MNSNAFKEIKSVLKLRAKAQETNNLKEESECCNVLGNEYFKIGDLDNALSMHKSELHLCQSIHDVTGGAVACRKIGDVYVAMRMFPEAIAYHTKHFKMSKGNDLELQRAHASLGRTYLEYGHFIDGNEAKEAFVKSIDFLKESLRIVARLKEDEKVPQKETNEMKVRSLINLGLCFHYLSGVAKSNEKSIANGKSKEFFEKALYLAKKFNFKEDLYLANFILATVNTDQKQYSNALRNAEEAISFAKAMKRAEFVLEASELCARVHLYMENKEAAKLMFKKLYKRNTQARDDIKPRLTAVIKMCHISSQIESSENDAEKLSRLHEALADTYCNMACYYPAVKHYKIQAKLLDQISSATSQQKRTAFFSIASTLADAGAYKEAIQYYNKELQCTTDQTEQCKTLTHIADCMEKMEAGYHEIVAVYENALVNSVEAKDDLLTLKTLASLELLQKNSSDEKNRSKTKCAISELELKLGVSVDEILAEDANESFQNSFSLDDSEDLFEAEMRLSDEDDSDQDEPIRRRRRTNFNKTNEKGETLLHVACVEGQVKSAEVLIRQGHPVNPRDFCGWIPLHEACNRGYIELLKLLLKHGANIDDTGGQYCDNITPINDAAINGHFEAVEIMLDAGANPNIANSQGKTTLDSLIHYYHQHKEDLDSASKRDYKRLYKRLKSLGDVPAEPPVITSYQSPSALVAEDEPTSTTRLKELDNTIPHIQRDRARTSLSTYLKAAAGSSKRGLHRDRSRCEIGIDSNSSDDDIRTLSTRTQSKNDVKFENQFVSQFADNIPDITKRNRKSTESSRLKLPRSTSKSFPDVLSLEDEIVDDDDWMVPDDVSNYSQPMKKPKRGSTQLKRIDPSLADWGHADFQTDQSAPAVNDSSQSVSMKQQPTAFRLRVKINDQAFMVVVPGRDKTVAWLTEKAASRYEEVTKLKPILSLSTADGCLLSPEDSVFDVLSSNDVVMGKVGSWNVIPLTQKYTETCQKEHAPELPLIKQACEICQATNSLQLLNLGYTYKHHLKPLILCLSQQEVHKILLPGSQLDVDGLSGLCGSLSAPSPAPLTPLVELNLTSCYLTDEALSSLLPCTRLYDLKRLSLSFNPLCDGNNLLKFLTRLEKLEALNLKSCWLSEKFFQETGLLAESKKVCASSSYSGFQNLEQLNISRNEISTKYLEKLLRSLNRTRLKILLLSEVSQSSRCTSFISVLVDYILKTADKMKLIDVSDNQLEDEHIAKLRQIEHLSDKIYI